MTLKRQTRQRAQAALEYLLLLTVVAVVTFTAIKPSTTKQSVLNKAQTTTEDYFKTVAQVIVGKDPQPINGGLCAPKPDGEQECACPAPAFGGKPCYPQSANLRYCGDGWCAAGIETGKPGHPDPDILNDPLQTCYEDCPIEPDCSTCGDMIPSASCGVNCPNAASKCNAGQICMVSDCPAGCGSLKKFKCENNPLLCSVNCLCTGRPTPITNARCGGPGIFCGPHPLGVGQKCYSYKTGCSAECSDNERYVPTNDGSCSHCNNGLGPLTDSSEVAVDCGGTDCRSCCGNGRIDNNSTKPAGDPPIVNSSLESCDNGVLNGTPGNECSSRCLLAANCEHNTPPTCAPPAGSPNGTPRGTQVIPGYCCGTATEGKDYSFDPTRRTSRPCSIPKMCDKPGPLNEEEATCPADCYSCVPNGNCISATGVYSCGGPTLNGVDEGCPTIPCTIPVGCDAPTESCVTCPQDCDRGTCVANGAYTCGGPPTSGHFSNCSPIACSYSRSCGCTGTVPTGAVLCPEPLENSPTTDTPNTLVSTCTAAKCEYTCPPNYVISAGGCVANFPPCAGRFESSTCGQVWINGAPPNGTVVSACPVGCTGGVVSTCVPNLGWVRQTSSDCGPVAASNCPATPREIFPGCGITTIPSGTTGNYVRAECGPNCDGGLLIYCENGTYTRGNANPDASNLYSWGCRLKIGASCVATPYTAPLYSPPSCGATVTIPALVSGQASTTACPSPGCPSGLITASCVNGTVSISNNCAYCGNGTKESSEQCDRDTVDCGGGLYRSCNATCSGYSACLTIACGNFVTQTGEQCDDGNTASGDGCNSVCVKETCSDGVINNNETGFDVVAGGECGGSNCAPCPVRTDGVCASAKNQCRAGTPSVLPDNPPNFNWICQGIAGGINSGTCTVPMPVNGVCQTTTAHTCNPGTLGTISDTTTNYQWICNGINNGTNSGLCTKPRNGQCGTVTDRCIIGTFGNELITATAITWNCAGFDGTTTPCSVPVASHCTDGDYDPGDGEVDVDCGGLCRACNNCTATAYNVCSQSRQTAPPGPYPTGYTENVDCTLVAGCSDSNGGTESLVCSDGQWILPTGCYDCANGIKDPSEEGTDCGGPCATLCRPCADTAYTVCSASFSSGAHPSGYSAAVCDNVNGCQDRGNGTGNLVCNDGTWITPTGCYKCGDGVLDPSEECEGEDGDLPYGCSDECKIQYQWVQYGGFTCNGPCNDAYRNFTYQCEAMTNPGRAVSNALCSGTHGPESVSCVPDTCNCNTPASGITLGCGYADNDVILNNNETSQNFSCSSECTGAWSAKCVDGGLQITDNCVSVGCPAFTYTTDANCGTVNIGAYTETDPVPPIGCPAGCEGAGIAYACIGTSPYVYGDTCYKCGDGQVTGTIGAEICDTAVPVTDQTCATVLGAGSTGTVTCAAGCKSYNTSGCTPPTGCPDGTIGGSEQCDCGAFGCTPVELNNQTCAGATGRPGSTGTLGCSAITCQFDVSLCS